MVLGHYIADRVNGNIGQVKPAQYPLSFHQHGKAHCSKYIMGRISYKVYIPSVLSLSLNVIYYTPYLDIFTDMCQHPEFSTI
jgi:hypothetical protein